MTKEDKAFFAGIMTAEAASIQLQKELIEALRAMVGDGKTSDAQALVMARAVLAKLEQK
jgi:hypothetical protein